MQRHVLRAIPDLRLPIGAAEWQPAGPVLIVGHGPEAELLNARLLQMGGTVTQLAPDENLDQFLTRFDQLLAATPFDHLFLMGPRRSSTSTALLWSAWESEWKQRLLLPYLVIQRWAQRHSARSRQLPAGLVPSDSAGSQGIAPPAALSLVAAVSLGGDFGTSGYPLPDVASGGWCGLLKGIRREFPQVLIKAVDVPAEEAPAAVVEAVLTELACGRPELEAGYIRGVRQTLSLVPVPASSQRPSPKIPQGTWVVTGGGRGVTAVVARELARRYGLTLHLLGSSPEPEIPAAWRNVEPAELKRQVMEQARREGKTPVAAWQRVERLLETDRTLTAYRQAGVTIHYHSCDVSNAETLGQTLAAVRRLSGPIRGIIHGAGIEAACRFEKKQRATVEQTLAIKVNGAVALFDLCKDDPLDYLIGFGSTSGRFGGLGQTDYSMASDLLCKLCAQFQALRPELRAVGIHWPPWDEVGMAARPESKLALSASGLTFMPPAEGAAHVIDELSLLLAEPEVAFIDNIGGLDSDSQLPTQAAKGALLKLAPGVAKSPVVDLLRSGDPAQPMTLEATFDGQRDPFLLAHRHRRVPILPAVMGLELFAESLHICGNFSYPLNITNFTIQRGLRFHAPHPVRALISAEADGAGMRCRLTADFHDRHGRLVDPHRSYMEATLTTGDPAAGSFAAGVPPEQFGTIPYYTDWESMPEGDDRIYHGRPLQGLQGLARVADGAWGRIIAPDDMELRTPAQGPFLLGPATLDACLLAVELSTFWEHGVANLPEAAERITLLHPIQAGQEYFVFIRFRGRVESGTSLSYDLILQDRNGTVVARIEGYRVAIVSDSLQTPARFRQPTWEVCGNSTGQLAAATRVEAAPSSRAPALGRLLARKLETTGSAQQYLVELDPQHDPFLTQHLVLGEPRLPGVIGLELMLEAARASGADPARLVVNQFSVHAPLAFSGLERASIVVKVERQEHEFQCRIEGVEQKRLHQSCVLNAEEFDAPPVIAAPGQPHLPFHAAYWTEAGPMVHGPAFHCLQELLFQRDGGWAKLTMRPADELYANRPAGELMIPAALLDSCIVACGMDTFCMVGPRVEIPQSVRRLRFRRIPTTGEELVLRLLYRSQDAKGTTYDFCLFDQQGNWVIEGIGYRGAVINVGL